MVTDQVPQEIVGRELGPQQDYLAHQLTRSASLANALPFVEMPLASGGRHDPTSVNDLLIPIQLGEARTPPQRIQDILGEVRREREPLVTRSEEVYGLVALAPETCVVRPQTYLDFFCTNGAFGLSLSTVPDLPKGVNLELTLGQALMQHYGRLPPFSAGIGANTLGVASLVVTLDNMVILAKRGAGTGVNRGLNVPTSGSVQYKPVIINQNALWHVLKETVEAEAEEELGLTPDQYEIMPIGAAREVPRGGSPEWFFTLQTVLSYDEFVRQYTEFDGHGKQESDALYGVNMQELFASLDSEKPLELGIHPKAVLAALFARRAS